MRHDPRPPFARSAGTLLAVLCALASFGCGNGKEVGSGDNEGGDAPADVRVLTFCTYAADKPTSVVRQFRPVLSALEPELSKRLGQTIRFKTSVASSYDAGIAAIADGRCDLARLGPASFVFATKRNPGLHVIAMEAKGGKKTFNGVIAVREDATFKQVEDLKGASFAFGDELSTIGRFLSQNLLMQHGVYQKDLSSMRYLGRHDAVAAAVAAGDFDAGALKESTFKKKRKAGAPLRALAFVSNVTKPWVGREDLDAATIDALRASLLGLEDEAAFEALGKDGFVEGSAADYAPIREAMAINPKFAGS